MKTNDQPRILCVDDEPNILEALTRQLHADFAVTTATSGAAGLEILGQDGPFAVVVSDMRMPGMDGAAFLRRAREVTPDTVRVLLTGHTNLPATIAAVNEGNIFRFLTKPCELEVLLGAIEASVEQYRLVTAERVLLQQTLHGSIKALTDTLALANPAAFGRAVRIKQYVSLLASKVGANEAWQLEVAAMLSQIGYVTLPAETVEKLYRGQPLTESESAMAERLPTVTDELLANIPRLEPVREILRYQDKRFDGTGNPRDGVRGEQIPWGARLLKVVLDFDGLETQGLTSELALDTLRGRPNWYDPAVLRAFGEAIGSKLAGAELRELPLHELQQGMVFAEDVTTQSGLLLIARGQEVTPGLLGRVRNFSASMGVREPIRVIIRNSAAEDSAGARPPAATASK